MREPPATGQSTYSSSVPCKPISHPRNNKYNFHNRSAKKTKKTTNIVTSDSKRTVCRNKCRLYSPLRKCPTPGCDGSGHVTGRFTAHHCISGCPLAERNQGRLKADLSDSECKRNLFFGQRNKKNHYRGRLVCVSACLRACLKMFSALRSSLLPVFRIGRPPKYRKNQQREYQSEFSDNSQCTRLTSSSVSQPF